MLTMELKLPLTVWRQHIDPRVHEIRMRGALVQIQTYGPSRLEDLPDVYGHGRCRGWSKRSTEALGWFWPHVNKCMVLAQLRSYEGRNGRVFGVSEVL